MCSVSKKAGKIYFVLVILFKNNKNVTFLPFFSLVYTVLQFFQSVKLVSRILDLASKWNDRFGPKQDSGQQKTKPRIIWASSFVNLLKLNSTEKFLVPDAAVVYKKPPTLLNMLTNYRNIAHNESFQREVRAGLSHPCNKCALCGNFRYYNGKSMVPTVNHIKTAQGKLFFLKQNLTCSNYGIYAAQCKICQKST